MTYEISDIPELEEKMTNTIIASDDDNSSVVLAYSLSTAILSTIDDENVAVFYMDKIKGYRNNSIAFFFALFKFLLLFVLRCRIYIDFLRTHHPVVQRHHDQYFQTNEHMCLK